MRPSHIPYPLMWGGSQPQIRLQLIDGNQVVFSRSNFGLYLDEKCFTDDGTYAIGSFLRSKDWQPNQSLAIDRKFVLPSCYECNTKRYDLPCPMLVQRVGTTSYKYRDSGQVVNLDTLVLERQPEIELCPVLGAVLGQCESEAEKRFSEIYYRWALLDSHHSPSDTTHLALRVAEWHKEQLNEPPSQRLPFAVSDKLVESLSHPALLPQVWLNYLYDPLTSPKELEKTTLRDMPSRVDFLLIYEGQRHVIEIDDPNHYARLDEKSRRWEIDEERYTRNLRIERGLKQQKWFVHRFSNFEVLNSRPGELLEVLCNEVGIEFDDMPF